jgi:hypothetical protein
MVNRMAPTTIPAVAPVLSRDEDGGAEEGAGVGDVDAAEVAGTERVGVRAGAA